MDENLRPTKSVRTNIQKFESLSQSDDAARSRSESAASVKSNASSLKRPQQLRKGQIGASGSNKSLIQVIDDESSSLSSTVVSPQRSPSPDLTPVSVKTPITSLSDQQCSPTNILVAENVDKGSPKLKSTNRSDDINPVKVQPASSHSRTPSLSSNANDNPNEQHEYSPEGTYFPKHAISVLRNNPTLEQLQDVLSSLKDGIERKHDFNVKIGSTTSAFLLNALVVTTITVYWDSLKSIKNERVVLLDCLSSVPGLTAVRAYLVNLIKDFPERGDRDKPAAISIKLMVRRAVSLLAEILVPERSHNFLSKVVADIPRLPVHPAARETLIQELVSLVSGSKLHSTISEAIVFVGFLDFKNEEGAWMGDSRQWSTWLGANVACAAARFEVRDGKRFEILGSLVKRGFSLGHPEIIVSELYTGLLFGSKALWPQMQVLYHSLKADSDREQFLHVMLHALTAKYLSTRVQNRGFELEVNDREAVGGVAAIIAGLVENTSTYEDNLVRFLTTDGDAVSFETKRAMLAVLADKEEKLRIVLEGSLRTFGDKHFIHHGSIVRQEVLAQVILLTFGYLHRMKSDTISEIAHSSLLLSAVSNRLAASLPRARFLGMILGTCVSRSIDAERNVMKFDDEDMESAEARWYRNLVDLRDEVGSIESLKTLPSSPKHTPPKSRLNDRSDRRRKPASTTSKPTGLSKVIAIGEIESSSGSDDEDLVPHQKPDDDPSDSDEDPTLINRSKPMAPVYISSLITQLRSDESETLEIALRTAPSLIRRKIGFGTEISENIDTLLSTLINLHEKGGELEEDDFGYLRLHSLIACFLALPEKVGLWLSSIYFEGDFSVSQRAIILTVIGLGSRELAGFEDGRSAGQEPLSEPTESFPSKRLPSNLSAIYSSASSPVSSIANQISHSTIQPLALSAADSVTGPNVLKIRTFSSRLSKTNQPKKPASRKKTIPKSLHHILSTFLFLPICTRLCILTSTSRRSMAAYPFFGPHLLRLTLQTLTLLLSTIGPSARQLHTLTREALVLLTTLHTLPPETSLDQTVLPAILQLLLTVLELNTDGAAGPVVEERLVTEFGESCAELVMWVQGLGGVVAQPAEAEEEGDGGKGKGKGMGKGMGMPWTVLAAGIQVKWMEVGRKFQGRMLGLMGGGPEEGGW